LLTFENKQGHNKLLLDLSTIKFCDSSGLSAILVANRLCKDTNGVFILTGIHPNVTKMIEIAQLDRVLLIHDTIENGLKGFE
jgi:anti-anti-sigma factor